jgi:hypothetical protein
VHPETAASTMNPHTASILIRTTTEATGGRQTGSGTGPCRILR